MRIMTLLCSASGDFWRAPPPGVHTAMKVVAAVVNRGFRRVERAAERVIGRAGPLFVAIYLGLVGTGVWLFCTWFV